MDPYYLLGSGSLSPKKLFLISDSDAFPYIQGVIQNNCAGPTRCAVTWRPISTRWASTTWSERTPRRWSSAPSPSTTRSSVFTVFTSYPFVLVKSSWSCVSNFRIIGRHLVCQREYVESVKKASSLWFSVSDLYWSQYGSGSSILGLNWSWFFSRKKKN